MQSTFPPLPHPKPISPTDEADRQANRRIQTATTLTIAITVLALLGGLLIRSRTEGATQLFTDSADGISVRYPANWLIAQGAPSSAYIFQAQDLSAIPFKTTLRISTVVIGPNATLDDVVSRLTVQRAQSLAAYHTLGITPIRLPDGTAATRLSYAYAQSDPNPFSSSVPVVVQADDVIILTQGQALIAGYESDAAQYNQNQRFFVAFLGSLHFQQ